MSEGRTRSAALPLLFAALVLAVATVTILFIGPTVACPPCTGTGYIQERRVTGSETVVDLYNCLLCAGNGRIKTATRLRSDPASPGHRGRLCAQSRWVETQRP